LSALAWDRLEDHQALINDKEEYTKLNAAMAKGIDGAITMYHARFPVDVTPAFDAPCTEILLWSLHESTDREEFRHGVKALVSKIGNNLKDEVLGGSDGEVVEDPKKVSVVIGWPSLEVCITILSVLRIEFISVWPSSSMRRFMVANGLSL
jgi:hypothetical protein